MSSLETSEGQTIITAQPGQDGHSYEGGAGYSGGGAGPLSSDYSGGHGGQDGGDGQDSSAGYQAGGTGSGLDISAIRLTSFSLTPGRGGMAAGVYGGGGGGVLVGGCGPQASEYDGQGYGGGGGRYGDSEPGLVLLEIQPKP